MVQLSTSRVSGARQARVRTGRFVRTVVDYTDDDSGKTEDGEWHEDALHWIFD